MRPTVVHVPEVLCHRTEARRDPVGTTHVQEALSRRGEMGRVTPGSSGTYHVTAVRNSRATVSIVIPFHDQPRFLRTCLDSVEPPPRSEPVEFVLIDNGSTDPEMLTLMEEVSTRPDVKLLSDPSRSTGPA